MQTGTSVVSTPGAEDDSRTITGRQDVRETDKWISEETEAKEQDFAGLLAMHMRICKSILGRLGGPPYLYVDCHAGPGHLEYGGRSFPGSPLIARQAAFEVVMPYEAVHFEQDKAVAVRLQEALQYSAPVVVDSCEQGVPRWLASCSQPRSRFGLVYADPIGKAIPVGLLSAIARALPKTDILAYVGATAYKRRNGARPGPRLLDDITTVQRAGKSTVLIRKPLGRQQWTFVLWSNWVKMPEWQRRGFHRLDTETGRSIAEYLNYTRDELHELTQPVLFGEGEDALSAAPAR